MTLFNRIDDIAARPGRATVGGTPEGLDAWTVARIARQRKGTVLHVALDDARATAFAASVQFFAPEVGLLSFPAWDCLPYDRMSPRPEISAQRMTALAALARDDGDKALVVVTTVNALLQRLPPRSAIAAAAFGAATGDNVSIEKLVAYLDRNGYSRASTVMEPGDYAVRGGIVDLFPPNTPEPVRLDFFGDTIDAIRSFDPETQRTTRPQPRIDLLPVSEAPIDKASIARFRAGYVAAFGAVIDDDALYASVSEGRKQQGMEHWLPLFYERLETLFDYIPGAAISFEAQAEESRDARLALVSDYYEARVAVREQSRSGKAVTGTPIYKPLKPATLYLDAKEWDKALDGRTVRFLTPFKSPEGSGTFDSGGNIGRSFAIERGTPDVNVFDAVVGHVRTLLAAKSRVIVACWSTGSADRMGGVLADHGLAPIATIEAWGDVEKLHAGATAVAVLGLERGFAVPGTAVISEQDILGDRLVRSHRKSKRAANFIAEAASLQASDLVVHVDHGIGRYLGLKTLDVQGAPHDCLEIQYDGGKLFLPVENIELLTRYGGDDSGAELDRLGGSGWQSRKAKLKNRIREIAEHLIRVAAERKLKTAPRFDIAHGLYEEFCARFPYEETEDQQRTIADVMEDFARGQPTDRLICGDVGFGKTEVALRAAFVAAMSGKQVAVVVPTTLLSRQHFKTFSERFAGWPLQLRQLSRLVSAKEASETRKGLTDGQVDIVIGTHALLAKSIAFKDLGLLVVDEEQHFGVAHKERLKQLRTDVHVLTLTATPIPRTLQLAMSGVRDMSLIATPPVDRLAVRTFVGPFDPVTVREALLREHFRGGQSFYVVPRISDLAEAMEFLKATVPEVKPVMAHGQLAPGQLDDVMNAFYDRQYDVLLSTTIVESGLDIPTANTLIVHRADMFGLSQLYQLRGRIGRSKQRAYAYLTVPQHKLLTPNAERRLKVLQALDTLGAGFSLASHDLDIRGAGNLLGEEQSGHIREVGLELYQDMLEEAVIQLRSGERREQEEEGQWSPQISLGAAVLIPESYVPDLNVRLSLYRRLSDIQSQDQIEGFAAELIDRFGKLPDEVRHLLDIVAIKKLCREAGIEKIEAGPKGAIISFRNNRFANPAGLIAFINDNAGTMKVRPDQKIVYMRSWGDEDQRLRGASQLLKRLAEVAKAA